VDWKMTTTLAITLWKRVSICAINWPVLLQLYIMYTAYLPSPISESFGSYQASPHGPHSTQLNEEINNYDLEDDHPWPQPRIEQQTIDQVVYPSTRDSRRPTPRFTDNTLQHHTIDSQSTSTEQNSHPYTPTQSYNSNAQRKAGRSLEINPENMHRIRLRPISDLRLFLKVSLQA
jgi:hypothetical protein